MKNQTLIDDVRYCFNSKKYLGVNRMRKILNEVLNKLELPLTFVKEIPIEKQFEYKKHQYNEWLYVNNYKLYKSNTGYFILTLYQYYDYDDSHSIEFLFGTELNPIVINN